MYLIVSTETTSNYLCSELSKLHINAFGLPCVQLIPDYAAINQFKQQINNFDIIIITSPSVIEYANEIFEVAPREQIFIVPGFSSYTKLRQYTGNKIYTPGNNSGAAAIIHEVLENMNLSQKNIAILHGKRVNTQILNYLYARLGEDSYTPIIVYNQKWLDLDIHLLKKLLMNNYLQGIILTSSMHARYIFSQAQKFGYYDLLLQANFITLHTKIRQILQTLGAKNSILVSDAASNYSLIELIKRNGS